MGPNSGGRGGGFVVTAPQEGHRVCHRHQVGGKHVLGRSTRQTGPSHHRGRVHGTREPTSLKEEGGMQGGDDGEEGGSGVTHTQHVQSQGERDVTSHQHLHLLQFRKARVCQQGRLGDGGTHGDNHSPQGHAIVRGQHGGAPSRHALPGGAGAGRRILFRLRG